MRNKAMDRRSTERGGTLLRYSLSSAAILSFVLVGVWAGATIATPESGGEEAAKYALVVAKEGDIGSSLNLNASAQWSSDRGGTHLKRGTVTSIEIDSSKPVITGTVLFRVNLNPVVIAEGTIPAFRPIGLGAKGEDVRQVQRLLESLGYYSGKLDGEMGKQTETAVKTWQKSLGTEQTGIVETGDVIFVESLPAQIGVDDSIIFRGAQLSGGERAVIGYAPAPDIFLSVTPSQAVLIPTGASVTLSIADHEWKATTATQSDDEDGNSIIQLVSTDETSICNVDCEELIALVGKTILSAEVEIVPMEHGVVIPTAALVSNAEGATFLVAADGGNVEVVVKASANGMSLVSGARPGEQYRLAAVDDGS